jgi:general secretion pathway protein H
MASRAETAPMPISGADKQRRNRRKTSGFSFIEVLIVVTIGAGLATLAAVSFAGRQDEARFRTHIAQVEQFLVQARSTAILSGQEVIVVQDAASGQIAAQGWANAPRLPLDLGIRIASTGNAPVIRFYPAGGSSGGSILLQNDARQARIDVDWLTGRVLQTAGAARGS